VLKKQKTMKISKYEPGDKIQFDFQIILSVIFEMNSTVEDLEIIPKIEKIELKNIKIENSVAEN
jgi:hypothetical protein